MYQIDKNHNQLNRLETRTFSELGFRERDHLQEWIAKDPSCLGEELLIIQKEFDGFQNTRERLDLLALDKEGRLVIIENKLDDSGRDVSWQAIKYASYCSSLSKDEIRRIFQDYLDRYEKGLLAEERIVEFLGKEDFAEIQLNTGYTQRLMLVAANFRKEVTSTILWLFNFGLRIQCFKVSLSAMGEQVFLSFDQILPVKDTEEYTISMANKSKEEIFQQEGLKERHKLRLEFWAKFLSEANEVHSVFSSISSSKDAWIGTGIGMSGINLNLGVAKSYTRGEIYISRGNKEENERCFDFLLERKELIEKAFGAPLIWERMDEKIDCRIKAQLDGVSLYDKAYWQQMITYLIDISEKLNRTFRPVIRELNSK
ncbi:MAG: DUF4268 domain-containing protein [Bacteroidota bacterium]